MKGPVRVSRRSYCWGPALIGGMTLFLIVMTSVGWENISTNPLKSVGIFLGIVVIVRCLFGLGGEHEARTPRELPDEWT